jgi:hypothetical protein
MQTNNSFNRTPFSEKKKRLPVHSSRSLNVTANNRFINRFLILLIFLPITSFAVGWNDYSQDIGDGFKITRFNSIQIMLYDKKDWGSVIPTREHGGNIGPITHYFSGVDNLFIKTAGLVIKKTENGREYKAQDYSKTFYFIVNKSNSVVKGPLTQAEFKILIKPNINIRWETPSNPNILVPLFGYILIFSFVFFNLLFEYWFVTFPIIGAACYLLIKWKRKRRNKANQLGLK